MKIKKKTYQEAAQTALAKEEQSAHFYTQEGLPRYTDTVQSGKNKGKECAVTLRHARKENLYPSITQLFKLLSARGLQIYRESHLLAAARKLQPYEHETDEEWVARVNFEARKDGSEAAQQGTNYHKEVEAILKGEPWNTSDKKLIATAKFFDDNLGEVLWLEKSCVNHTLRVAGRCDALLTFKKSSPFNDKLHGAPVVVDFKTRRFKEFTAKPFWRAPQYTKDLMQVAFYASTVERNPSRTTDSLNRTSFPRSANFLINTTEEAPDDLPPEFRLYDPAHQFSALLAVAHLSALWRHENNYHPERDAEIPVHEWQRMHGLKERMLG